MQDMPYASVDYYSQQFHAYDLTIKKEHVTQAEKRHTNDEIEGVLVLAGTGQVIVNGQTHMITAGSLLLLMPYHIHQLIPETELEIYRFTFSLGLFLLNTTTRKEYATALKNVADFFPLVKLNARDEQEVRQLCQVILRETQQQGASELLNLGFISLLTYVFQKAQVFAIRQKKLPPYELLKYLHLHYQQPLTLKKVAQQFELSTEAVQQKLITLSGANFAENLNRVRIRNARALMPFEELSLNQIGKLCGYQSEAAFYQAFKQQVGTTPGAYRQPVIKNFKTTRIDAWEVYLYIQENFAQPLTLKKAAQELNLTTKQIQNLLLTTFDARFQELLLWTRLYYAKNLLLSLKQPVKHISQMVGFQDVAVFTKKFKQQYGTTPKQYAKEHFKPDPAE
ncbi:AraC family transcriptional regulator [Enterococcus sp. CSURQ0835]|uniref:AraC family transcriptional regulator n=1 Tax=Enterococcus sp. CSURQ0835 TaxID=2681394 RepID=UPI00135A14F9|nr:AraC family transcriptional regulator [Enterococcus sp. CSURQ0835]